MTCFIIIITVLCSNACKIKAVNTTIERKNCFKQEQEEQQACNISKNIKIYNEKKIDFFKRANITDNIIKKKLLRCNYKRVRRIKNYNIFLIPLNFVSKSIIGIFVTPFVLLLSVAYSMIDIATIIFDKFEDPFIKCSWDEYLDHANQVLFDRIFALYKVILAL
jgi:hypothetical protein